MLTALLLLLLLCGQVTRLVVGMAQLGLLCQAMQQVLQAAWPHRGLPLLHRMHCAIRAQLKALSQGGGAVIGPACSLKMWTAMREAQGAALPCMGQVTVQGAWGCACAFMSTTAGPGTWWHGSLGLRDPLQLQGLTESWP